MYTYPRLPNLAYPARVLFNEGALLEAILRWGRARAGRRGNPKVDAAPGGVLRKHKPGRPWVSVRPVTGSATVSWLDGDRRAAQNAVLKDLYGGLPSPRKNGPGF